MNDNYLIQTLQYRFKSDKSHHAYIVKLNFIRNTLLCEVLR